ncbi:MAG: hypothetical protein JO254_06845 [Pseudolabrys sp.]|nr:hypothetical protein [Pseudolabrys sp.]
MTLSFRPHLIAALAALLAALCLPPPALAETVFLPARRVGLEPLPGMQLEPGAARFIAADGKASITLLELPPAAFPDLEKGLFSDPQRGVTLFKRELFPFATGMGYFAAVRVVTPNGNAFLKYVLTSASPDLAFIASFEMPEEASSAYPEETVRKVLASVTVRDPPLDERLKLLPFSLSDLADFQLSDVQPGGVVLTDPQQPSDLPRIFISIGQGAPESAEDRSRFAFNLMRNAPLPDMKIVSNDAQRIRGMPGYEIRAQAKDPVSGTDAAMIQWVRFAGTNYLVVFAVARAEQWDRFYTRFRAVRDGVEPR